MPPVGLPRPDERTYDAVIASLETDAGSRAAAKPESRPHRHVPPAESHRIPERHPRPAGARRRRRGAAARGRGQPRLRQRDGRRPLADAAGPLRRRGAEDQPAGGRAAPSRSPGGDTIRLPPDLTQEEHVEGLPLGTRGGTLIRYTFPAGRRVRDPGPPARATATSTSKGCTSRTSSKCCSTASG